jgi:hypothetical protein
MVPKLKVKRKACHAATGISMVDQRADIEFDISSVEKADRDTLDLLICHELQHIVCDGEDTALSRYLGGRGKSKVFDDYCEANEKVCDHNAAIVVAAYRRKRDRPK